MWVLLVEYIFLTTVYRLCRVKIYTSTPGFLTCGYYQIQLLIFIEKFSPLLGFEPKDLPSTKPICYQLSYPGLDTITRV